MLRAADLCRAPRIYAGRRGFMLGVAVPWNTESRGWAFFGVLEKSVPFENEFSEKSQGLDWAFGRFGAFLENFVPLFV